MYYSTKRQTKEPSFWSIKWRLWNEKHGKRKLKKNGTGVEGFLSQERWPRLGYIIICGKAQLGPSLL